MAATIPPDLDPAVAAFADRLRTRDQPVVVPLRFDRASVEARLAAGLIARFPGLQRETYRLLARLLYGFLTERRRSTAALAEELLRNETSILRRLRPLLQNGLLERTTQSTDARQKVFRLTRAGEDWLQTLVQVPLPEPPTPAVPLGE